MFIRLATGVFFYFCQRCKWKQRQANQCINFPKIINLPFSKIQIFWLSKIWIFYSSKIWIFYSSKIWIFNYSKIWILYFWKSLIKLLSCSTYNCQMLLPNKDANVDEPWNTVHAGRITISHKWAVVVAQLVEWSLLIPEVRSSNPVIGKIYIEHLCTRLLPTVLKRQK